MFKSIVGMSYSCPNQIPGYFYVFKNANGITYPDLEMTMDAKVAIKAIVHPHPSPQDTI